METRRLYYEDAYIREFQATVTNCRETKNGFRILLDQSAFYPEGGGQPSDKGWLGDAEVLEVHEKEGELLHYTAKPLPVGAEVTGRIDWQRRFDLMQQHSGEHMVSGLVHEKFGYDNVGFHMGADVITIDFNGMLSESDMRELEERVNREIWADTPVEILYPTPEELSAMPYRSKKELTGQVRVVRFPGVDLCACCGTHVARTGEIGAVRLLSVEKFREGVRMEMISGGRVMDYLNMLDGQIRGISVQLSAKLDHTAEAVHRLQEENFRLKGAVLRMEEDLFSAEAQRCAGAGSVMIFKEGLESDSVRRLTDAVMQTCGGCCAVFSAASDGSFKYAVGELEGDLRQFTKEMNAALSGRGGGKPFFVQGSVHASGEEIRRFLADRKFRSL